MNYIFIIRAFSQIKNGNPVSDRHPIQKHSQNIIRRSSASVNGEILLGEEALLKEGYFVLPSIYQVLN